MRESPMVGENQGLGQNLYKALVYLLAGGSDDPV